MGYLQMIYMYGFLISTFMLVIVFATAKNEVVNAMKLFWAKFKYKKRVAQIKFIMPDTTVKKVYVGITGSSFDYEGNPFFINPLKSTMENNMKTFYYVNNNAASHDFFNSPKEMVKKIVAEAKEIDAEGKKKTPDVSDKFHNIFDEPYRFDATMMQEAMVKAQLGNQLNILDRLFKIITSKNLITLAGAVALAATLAAVFSFMGFDAISQAQLCAQQQVESIINI